MSDTLDAVDPGTIRMPNSTGDNTTQVYGVFYPYDGLLVPADSRDDALNDVAAWESQPEYDGAMAVRITIERLDP